MKIHNVKIQTWFVLCMILLIVANVLWNVIPHQISDGIIFATNFGLGYVVIKVGIKQWIPYNEKEKAWLKEESEKAKDGKLNRFIMSIPIFRLIAGRKNEDEIKPDDEKLR